MPRTAVPVVRLRAGNTHLYPGARLYFADTDEGPVPGDDLLVEFADLGVVHGQARAIPGAPQRLAFCMRSHRTTRGATVPARGWIVEPVSGAPDHASHRVVARLRNGVSA